MAKTINNSWSGRNKKGEYWTNITGNWKLATTNEEIQLIKDLISLSKIKSIDVKPQIDAIVTGISLIPDWLPEVEETKNEATANKVEQTIINPDLLKENHLVKYLNDNNMKLTELEVLCLKEMLGQGSFYEESFSGNDEEWYGSAFIGWEITEKEVKGCRGAISSLQKKGILDIGTDDTNGRATQCYWIKHILDFKKDSKYCHDLDIPEQFIKKSRAR